MTSFVDHCLNGKMISTTQLSSAIKFDIWKISSGFINVNFWYWKDNLNQIITETGN